MNIILITFCYFKLIIRKIAQEVSERLRTDHYTGMDENLIFQGRLCVPNIIELKN